MHDFLTNHIANILDFNDCLFLLYTKFAYFCCIQISWIIFACMYFFKQGFDIGVNNKWCLGRF